MAVFTRTASAPNSRASAACDGAPIPAEHVSKLFEPYFTTKRSGTGLGLATVKKIVDEHQGEIAIAGGQEKGTSVTIQLPTAAPRGGRFRGRGGRGRRHRLRPARLR